MSARLGVEGIPERASGGARMLTCSASADANGLEKPVVVIVPREDAPAGESIAGRTAQLRTPSALPITRCRIASSSRPIPCPGTIATRWIARSCGRRSGDDARRPALDARAGSTGERRAGGPACILPRFGAARRRTDRIAAVRRRDRFRRHGAARGRALLEGQGMHAFMLPALAYAPGHVRPNSPAPYRSAQPPPEDGNPRQSPPA